jgi:hypothetical protein
MNVVRVFLGILTGAFVIGCTTVPSIEATTGKPTDPPRVTDLVTHIQCEIWDAVSNKGTNDGSAHELTTRQYIAFATLTVDVTNLEGTSPSLSFITPYLTPMTNLTKAIGGQYNATQHRTITQSFTIDLTQPAADAKIRCPQGLKEGHGLRGDLGLELLVNSGLAHVSGDEFVFKRPSSNGPVKLNALVQPVFGSTVDFTIVYGISNVGPSWTLTHFKGPGSGTSGLLTLTRTEKDTLVISFAPACPDGPPNCPPPASATVASLTSAIPQTDETEQLIQHQMDSLSLAPHATPLESSNFQSTKALLSTNLAVAKALNQLRYQSQVQLAQQAASAPSAAESAAKAAQDNNTRMILQNLLTTP